MESGRTDSIARPRSCARRRCNGAWKNQNAIAVNSRPMPSTSPARYDGAIMMSRTQIALEPEVQRRARQRANDLGVSLAEYLRRLVSRDLGTSQPAADPSAIFDLGSSGGSNIAKNKDAKITEAFAACRRKSRRS